MPHLPVTASGRNQGDAEGFVDIGSRSLPLESAACLAMRTGDEQVMAGSLSTSSTVMDLTGGVIYTTRSTEEVMHRYAARNSRNP